MSQQPQPFALVIGDPMLDKWISGEMSRISPEAPVPILLQKDVQVSAGGAANVAVNIKSLGGQVFFAAGVNARSEAAITLKRLFEERYGVATCLCHGDRLHTATKTRVVVGGQQVLRVDDDQPWHEPSHVSALLRGVHGVTTEDSQVRLLVAADYNKGCFVPGVIQYLKDVSAAQQWPLFVDAKPAKIRDWAGATLLKVNAKEAIQVALEDGCLHPGLSTPESAPEIAAQHLHRTYRFTTVAVTCGAEGVAYWDGNQLGRLPATPCHVYDVTGAGDVFLATMAVSYLEGLTFAESLFRANVAAGLAVQRHGTVAITRDELEDALRQRRGWAGKMLGIEAATALVDRKRALGKSIVLANGCFDALHVGHIQLLAYARQQGDLLVAAYNDDASVKALKGPERPRIAETFRAAQLAMLETVDCVVRFDGDIEALVRKLRPDVLVKGAQYREACVPGADFVASRGGRVVFAPMVERLSTSELVQANAAPRVDLS